MINDDDTTPF